MSKRFVVVSEARADFETATELADRVLVDGVEWLDEELLGTQREWIGEDPSGRHLGWTSIAKRARDLGIRVQGHFGERPGEPDAQAARRAILYVLKQFALVDAILLIRDLDNQPERRQGLEQARSDDRSGRTIVVGMANCERESWVLSGFEPQDDQERERLASEDQRLGFDPCWNAHLLNAKRDHESKSSKRVLGVLTNDSAERMCRCWRETQLSTLRDRGRENGLAEYLDEIASRLTNLISGRGPTDRR